MSVVSANFGPFFNLKINYALLSKTAHTDFRASYQLPILPFGYKLI
jgi:hypothetical protein